MTAGGPLVYVDDATSRLMVVLLGGSESTFGYFEATRQYIHRYGKPLAFYCDKASIFRVNHKTATNGKGHTQFARALFELNIEGLCANTPGAKLQYERKIYMLADNSENRRLIGKYIDVLQFPDGHVEIRVGGQALPYSTYDRVGVIDQGAVVNHKRPSSRLGHVTSFSVKGSKTLTPGR